MRNHKLLLTFLIIFMISACSSDDNISSVDSGLKITKAINKVYTFYDSNYVLGEIAILTDSIEVILNNNKIVSYSGLSNINDLQKTINGNITYSSNKIFRTEGFENNELSTSSEYIYDNSGELIERKSNEWESVSQKFYYEKSDFTHTTDTIFSNHYNSSDGIDYNLIGSSKTVLDNNNNRVYYESNGGGTIIETYDSNNNMLSSNVYGGTVYNYTYSNVFNTQALINNNTYGKKIQSMIFGEGSLSVMGISTNTHVSTSQEGLNVSMEVETIANQNNYSTKTVLVELSGGNPVRKTITEYLFE